MKVYTHQGYVVLLNGQPAQDWQWADDEAGQVCALERHWSTGVLVQEPDGRYREIVLTGRVEIVSPPPGSLPAPREPCYVCGGDCSGGCCQMCCLSSGKVLDYDPLTQTVKEAAGPDGSPCASFFELIVQQMADEWNQLILEELLSPPCSSERQEKAIADYQEASRREKRLDQLLMAPPTRSCSLCGESPEDDVWTLFDLQELCSGCVLQMAENVREIQERNSASIERVRKYTRQREKEIVQAFAENTLREIQERKQCP